MNDLFDTLKRAAGVERGHNYGVSKPRILVCAPSNAATDNLLERVMSRGFRKTDGAAYYPDVVRVGAADAMVSEKVTAVHAQAKVEGLMRMSPREWDAHYRKQDAFAKEAAACISHHERRHVDAARRRAGLDDAARDGSIEPDELVRAAERLNAEDDARVREMLRLNDDRNKAVADMARLAYLLTHLGGRGGGGPRCAQRSWHPVSVSACLIVRLAPRYPTIRLWGPARAPPGTHYVLLWGGRFLLHQRVAVSTRDVVMTRRRWRWCVMYGVWCAMVSSWWSWLGG